MEKEKMLEEFNPEKLSHMLVENAKEFSGEEQKKIKRIADKIAQKYEEFRVKAEELLSNTEEVEALLVRVEKKIKDLPVVGPKLAYIPQLMLLIGSYVNGEYRDISKGEIILIIAALIYFVSPIDVIPDGFPIAGYLDDAAVVVVVMKWVNEDIDKYMEWREARVQEQ